MDPLPSLEPSSTAISSKSENSCARILSIQRFSPFSALYTGMMMLTFGIAAPLILYNDTIIAES